MPSTSSTVAHPREQQLQQQVGPPVAVGVTAGEENASTTIKDTKRDNKHDASVGRSVVETGGAASGQQIYMSSCVEYVVAETVRYYRERERMETGPPVAASLGSAGFEIGKVLGERLSRDKGPMASPLEVMKWICKEFWKSVFGKGIDNLRTNHKGTFVLRDTQFTWTRNLCQNVVGGVERLPNSLLAGDYLVLPCGILRGVLSSFGIDATVTADATALPQCDFTVVLV